MLLELCKNSIEIKIYAKEACATILVTNVKELL